MRCSSAAGFDAFAGIGAGTDDAIGFDLDGFEFGLALLTDQVDTSRSWTALQASADSLGLVGFDGFTASASDIDVAINLASTDGSVADFGADAVTVRTGSGEADTLDLTLDGALGETVQLEGSFEFSVADFMAVSGSIGFSRSGSGDSERLLGVGENIGASLAAAMRFARQRRRLWLYRRWRRSRLRTY